MFEQREGEIVLADDPANLPPDGHVVFIGRIRSPWAVREECPKNMRQAREKGGEAVIHIDEPYRPGLVGLAGVTHLIVLAWLDRAPRNLIVQKPRHAETAKGVFAMRSPIRPNPVGLHIARVISFDIDEGRVVLDAIDVLDGTPVIDLKPYIPQVDAFAGAEFG